MLTAKDEGSDRIVISAGTHVARCYGIIDLGTQYSERFGNWTRKVNLQFELPEELMDDGRPLAISKKYSLSLNDKANLKKDLESWLGRGVTEQEQKEGFSLGTLLGKPCLLSIIHAESNGKTYANIAAVMSVPKGTKVPDQSNPAVSYDVENGKDAVFEKLPEWIRTMIEQSKEFKDGDEPIEEETTDTPVPFEFPEEPVEPVVPAESYVYGPKTYSRQEWLESLHQASTFDHLPEPIDLDLMKYEDLLAVGKVMIKQLQDFCTDKKKKAAAEKGVK
jgi:hypothetical protein